MGCSDVGLQFSCQFLPDGEADRWGDQVDRDNEDLDKMVLKNILRFDLISDKTDEEVYYEEKTKEEKDVVTDNLGDIGRASFITFHPSPYHPLLLLKRSRK